MKNTGKRLLSGILCLVMLLSMVSMAGNATGTHVTVYFNATGSDWTNVFIFSWGSAGYVTGDWPGSAMTDLGNGIFSYEVPVEAEGIIFNDGFSQTSDLTMPTDGKTQYNYATDTWTQFSAAEPEPDTPPEVVLPGTQVTGNVGSGKNTAGAVSVELWTQGADKAAYAVSVESDTYTIENVAAGTYTMIVRKPNHVHRSYPLPVSNTPVTMDVRVCQLGDVTGDGQINVADVSRLYGHIRGTSKIRDAYVLQCANINGGSLNVADVSLIYAHVKNVKLIEPCNPPLPEPAPEEYFDKTVDDFPGYQVVSLDGQKDTNFLVYDKNVQELTATASTNVLKSANDEARIYTFSNPDAQMKALKPGDVFFVQGDEKHPNGVTVKVKDIAIQGSTAAIQGEEVTIDDLLEYADIDMDLPVEELIFDESELVEGLNIYVGEAEEEAKSRAKGETTLSGSLRPIVYEMVLTEMGASGEGAFAGGVASGEVEFNASFRFSIDNIHLTLKYNMKEDYFCYDLNCQIQYGLFTDMKMDGSWKLGKNGKGIPLISPKVWIPNTPFYVTCGITSRFELAGELDGQANFFQLYDVGASYHSDTGLSGYFNRSTDTKSGSGSLAGSILLAVDGKVGVGAPLLLEAFVDATVGVEFEGEMELWDYDTEEPGDSIHDCEKCVDGQVNLIYGCGAGLRSDLLDWILDDEVSLRANIIPETSMKLKDFYCSFRLGLDVEFDWDECPHKRWRTEVEVLNESNHRVSDALVEAIYPDGRTDSKATDSQGEAVLYLPDGNNTLKCSHKGQRGTTNVMIDEDVASATIKLKKERKMFVLAPAGSEQNIVVTTLQNAYPEAEFIFLVANYTHFGYNVYGLDFEYYGMKAGDVVVELYGINSPQSTNGWMIGELCAGILLNYSVPSDEYSIHYEGVYWLDCEYYPRGEMIEDTDPKLYHIYGPGQERVEISKRYDSSEYVSQNGADYYDLFNEWIEYLGIMQEDHYFAIPSAHRAYVCRTMVRAYPYINLLLTDEWNDYWDAWEEENQDQTTEAGQ